MKWSKRQKSLTEKGGFGPQALPISGRFPKETLGASWHWQVGITPRQVSAITLWDHHGTTEQGSLLASRRACHSFTQAHGRVSKAQQKICSLREQRTKAPSIFTLSWRIPDEPPRWKVVVESPDTPGFLAPGGEEFNPGPETRFDRSELLCNKVLLKYKGDRKSFWHRHQKGAERVPAC